jgi:uncharacterized protein
MREIAMMMIPTYVASSEISGIGCFAGRAIRKDQVVWRFDSIIDRIFPYDETERLPAHFRAYLDRYCINLDDCNAKIYYGDDARFLNSSKKPNLTYGIFEHIAARDIAKGEELTFHYEF